MFSVLFSIALFLAVHAEGGQGARHRKEDPKETPSALTMAQLHLKPRSGEDAKLILGDGENSYTLEATAHGQFQILSQNHQVLTASPESGVTVESLTSKTVAAEDLILHGIPQWKMVAFETFEAQKKDTTAAAGQPKRGQCQDCLKSGWSNDQTIECSFLSILSLDDKNHTLAKTFSALGDHEQLRLTATVHFIDDWQGQTAYAKIDNQYVWTETVDQVNGVGKFDVCGSSTYPETRFSSPIDITIPHHNPQVSILFGAVIEEGSEDTRFGVSNVILYTRSNKNLQQPKKQQSDK